MNNNSLFFCDGKPCQVEQSYQSLVQSMRSGYQLHQYLSAVSCEFVVQKPISLHQKECNTRLEALKNSFIKDLKTRTLKFSLLFLKPSIMEIKLFFIVAIFLIHAVTSRSTSDGKSHMFVSKNKNRQKVLNQIMISRCLIEFE